MGFAAHEYLSPQQPRTGLRLITLNVAWAEGDDALRDVLQPYSSSVVSMAKLIPKFQLSSLLLCKGQRHLSVLQNCLPIFGVKLELSELKTPPAAVQALLPRGCWTVALGRRPIQSLWTHTHTSDLKVSSEQLPLSGFSFFLFKSFQIILKKKKKNPNKGRAITHRKSLPFSPHAHTDTI